jgi:hypothetical protein
MENEKLIKAIAITATILWPANTESASPKYDEHTLGKPTTASPFSYLSKKIAKKIYSQIP